MLYYDANFKLKEVDFFFGNSDVINTINEIKVELKIYEKRKII